MLQLIIIETKFILELLLLIIVYYFWMLLSIIELSLSIIELSLFRLNYENFCNLTFWRGWISVLFKHIHENVIP